MTMTDDSVPSAEMRADWHKKELLKQALDNIDIWTAKLETSKKYLKKWEATAKHLKEEMELEKAQRRTSSTSI